jgi:hypothetical protein
VRCWLYVVLLGGCDRVFRLDDVTLHDALPDTSLPDAPLRDAGDNSFGCADGTREAFVDLAANPRIAGCDGAFSVGGLKPAPLPMCGRMAGDIGGNPLGVGCSATDLCAEDWHVCRNRLDVFASSPTMSCSDLGAKQDTFYATGQSGANGSCTDNGTDDVFGCGTLGPAPIGDCTPLEHSSNNACSAIKFFGGWACQYPNEVENITKSDPTAGGGVLCCRD